MDLNDIFVFTKVVQVASFTRAAQELGMPKSTVSRRVTALEARLGVRLLQRTTRRLGLTDVGRMYYERCQRIVAEVEDASRVVSSLQETPCGLLRVTAPLNFGFLGQVLGSFLKRYPEVQLELVCTDRIVGLIEEGFDLGIRAGVVTDTSLIARGLSSLSNYLVASPSYLKKRGRPKSPKDLSKHACMLFGAGANRAIWKLHSQEEQLEVTVSSRLTVNDFDMLYEATLEGLGIAMLPIYRCLEDLRTHRLERVLPAWRSPEIPVSAVYPSGRHLSAKVRAFVEHLQKQMTPAFWERPGIIE